MDERAAQKVNHAALADMGVLLRMQPHSSFARQWGRNTAGPYH
jgi:hypothetical protein